ncbi:MULTISPECIES: SMC-Scp complex subunit ScpB [unclassified Luteibacter]|uniref:SMC-Scp complex subunit ScpB n=1 Tax=unclassified Luteibacter TaxID=2620188 RepID=UPI0008B16F54|nr:MULTISPECIES: SMC-Scp complex subunit ScpB [unclassified Luteibacter]SEO81530.1 segregation and condensation protein B [Luteibacter sp. UNC138MFCol5.1]SEV99911.1 condensin subunit ScpB [Luteibacter sp. 329MFSha]
MQPEQLKPIVEAALLASTQPMTIAQLKAIFGEDEEVGTDELKQTLDALAADCEGRGVELLEVASGWRYQVRREVHGWVSRMWAEKPSRYSRALLETLALIAYRQPITRPEIEQIRGVVVSSNIIKTLEEREWIRVVGYRDVPGKPALFGTTRLFLDYFNLKSLDALPPLSEIRDLDELNPQMRLEGDAVPPAARAAMPDEGTGESSTNTEDDDDVVARSTTIEDTAAPIDAAEGDASGAANQLPDGDDVAAASPTADEAENPEGDVEDDAEKDTEESRA